MRATVLLLVFTAAASAANYSYSVYNPNGTAFQNSDLASWTKNGTISCAQNGTGCPVYSGAANGGSLILTTAAQNDDEVRITISGPLGTGGLILYVHSSSGALSTPAGEADTGTFDALQIYDPWCDPDGSCSAPLGILRAKRH